MFPLYKSIIYIVYYNYLMGMSYHPFAEDSLRKRGDECKIILK